MSRIAGRGRHLTVAVTAALALAACVGMAAPVHASAPAPAGPAWTAETAPVDAGNLYSEARLDDHTTWAVGTSFTTNAPLLLSRDDTNGQGWQEVPRPGDAPSGSWYSSVSASSAQNAWVAEGSTGSGNVPVHHWDGSTWQTTQAPVPKHVGNAALHLAAVSATDVWGAGWYWSDDGAGQQTLQGMLDHWDGAAWTSVALPAGVDVANFTAVSATSANDVWAVGHSSADQPAVLHYDGSSWKQATLPKVGLYGEIRGINVSGPNDVWAVGRVLTSETDSGHALAMHWNGSSWTRVKTPAQAGPLSSVAETPSGMLAVGLDHDQANGIALYSTAGTLRMQTLPQVSGAPVQPAYVDAVGDRLTVVGDVIPAGADMPAPAVLTSRW